MSLSVSGGRSSMVMGSTDDENIQLHTAAPAHCKRPVGAVHFFRRRAGWRRRDSRAALVGVADLGRGSRGEGLSDSAPVRDRRHRLLGSAAGEHPGPAIGTQREPTRYRSRTSCRSIQVDTSQQNVSAKFDVLVFPFLDVYGLLGYTKGTTKGLIQVPGEPILGIIEPRQLQLNAAFNGPTYGAGLTLQGGAKVSDWRDLTAFGVVDWNRTKTKLSFENETLIADTKPVATVFSARVGLHGTVGPSMGAAIWTGAMHQSIQQTVAGSVANTDLQFIVVQSPTKPWNTLLGGLIEFGKDGYVLLEGGLGARTRSSRQPCTGSDRIGNAMRSRRRNLLLDKRIDPPTQSKYVGSQRSSRREAQQSPALCPAHQVVCLRDDGLSHSM